MAETRLDQPRGVRRTGPHYDAEAFGAATEGTETPEIDCETPV